MYGVHPGVLENMMTSNSNLNSEGSNHPHNSGELNKIILQCFMFYRLYIFNWSREKWSLEKDPSM